jgi:hypothetical protein
MVPLLTRRVLACLLLAVFPAALRADGPVELRWKFTKGQVSRYLLKHREVRTVAVGDHKFVTTTDVEYELQWTVEDVDDQGTATIEQKLTALRMSSSGKDGDFQYDSLRGNESTEDYKKKLIHFYDQLRFASYRLKVKADGTLAEVHGFDKLIGEIGNALTSTTFNVIDFEGLNLHDDSFGWFLQQLMGTLPRAAVAKGAQWNQPVQARLTNFGELTGRNEFTLGPPVKVGEHTAHEMQMKGTQSLDLTLRWVGNNTLRGKLETTRLTGTMRFDAPRGRLIGSEVQIDLKGDLKVGANDKPVLEVSFQHSLAMEAKE